jgi:Sulfur transfer protein involved in thiamine biosynthesis
MQGSEIRVFFRGLPSEAEDGAEELDAPLPAGATVADLLERLAGRAAGKARHILDPERKTLRPEFLLTLNGRFLEKARFSATALQEGDIVEVFPVPTGG